MALRKPTGFLISALLLASALLHGCGGSSTDSTTIPSNVDTFFAHSATFRNDTSSTLFTWGYNAFGQLGNGNLETQAVAAPVPGLGAARLFSTGGNHTLAVTFANISSVYGWGWNRQGQIGPNPTPDSQAHSPVPVRIALPGSTAVNAIAAGGVHSLAVVDLAETTGAVRAWGLNSSGQLGNNSFADSSAPVFAVFSSTTRTTPLSGIATVAAGSSHSLALSAPLPGKVYSWGLNQSGQLGRDTTAAGAISQGRAGLVKMPDGTDLAGVDQIAAGGSTSYALIGGRVWFWGFNPTTFENVSSPTQIPIPPITIPGDRRISRLSAGWSHLLMLAEDGTFWGWGANDKAQLGDGTDQLLRGDGTTVIAPVQVRFSPSQFMTGVTEFIAFGTHSLAMSNGVWFGWGENANGQLGNPIATSSLSYIKVPVRVQGL